MDVGVPQQTFLSAVRLKRQESTMDRFGGRWSHIIGLLITIPCAGIQPLYLQTTQKGTLIAAEPMIEPRSGHTATLLADGRVLSAGGMRRNQDFYKSAELFDPATRKFRFTGDVNERRVGHLAVRLRSGRVLIAGGWVGRGCTDSAEVYDPETGRFTLLASRMTTPRGDAHATLLK